MEVELVAGNRLGDLWRVSEKLLVVVVVVKRLFGESSRFSSCQKSLGWMGRPAAPRMGFRQEALKQGSKVTCVQPCSVGCLMAEFKIYISLLRKLLLRIGP